MATRITQAMLRDIPVYIVEDASKETRKLLQKTKLEMADKLYESILGPGLIKALQELPPYLVTTQGLMRVGVLDPNGKYETALGEKFSRSYNVDLSCYKPGPTDRHQHNLYYGVPEGCPELEAWLDAHNKLMEHKSKESQLVSEVRAALSRVTTIEKAIAMWPERTKVLSKWYKVQPGENLPTSLTLEQLNVALTKLGVALNA
jgi:hypothetical protein